ncbi:lipopolysaccharide assembly protein LapA domain-containing protein [Falsirhodobacter deserti]|uniref:lipopolysaccharide assembly protein LapA domain-containing protein n=1 Tax=Falsirhodobacter deserti TaxID=1365611 RepID=UPI0013E3CD72|nr:lipopolysaccharide assembly protein LapA domain-containing protein [Falsirhodobacter deserti]
MLRWIRIVVLVILALILLGVAVANRELVTISLLPDSIASFFGWDWSLRMPLFLVILLAAALGLLIGFVWEFLRERRIRTAAIESQREASRLRAEVASMRKDQPRDEVLAILDGKAS